MLASNIDPDGADALVMFEFDGRAERCFPSISPGGQRDNDRTEFLAFLGEDIVEELEMFGVTALFHESLGYESFEARRQDVRRNAKAVLELSKTRPSPKYGVANDEEAPALANDLQRSRRRTVLGRVRATQHFSGPSFGRVA